MSTKSSNFINNKNNENNDLTEEHINFINDKKGDLYQLIISKKENMIEIKCNNTGSNIDDIYILLLTLKEIISQTSFKNVNDMFDILKQLTNNNCIIENNQEFISLKLLLGENKKINLELYNINKIKKDIKNNQILKEENENLKIKLNLMEKNIEKLNNKLDKHINLMNLICFYNSIDIDSYKLEDIYNTLNSKIILKREEFALINKGIKKILNKNIIYFKCLYEVKNDLIDENEFLNNLNYLTYSIIVILTKDDKRFGCFYKKNNNFNLGMGMNIFQQNNINEKKQIKKKYNFNNNSLNDFNNDNEKIIFNSNSSSNIYFVFSLDNLKIYYSCTSHDKIKNIPNFSILNNYKMQCSRGIETQNNNSLFCTYKLSGKNEFNIRSLELYEIELSN